MDEIVIDGGVVVREANLGSRKKPKTVSKRELHKKQRYSTPSGCNVFVPCKHNSKTLQCSQVRPTDAIFFRKILFSKNEKYYQDQMISRFIQVLSVKRKRPRQSVLGAGITELKSKPHNFSVVYKFPISSGKNTVKVCKIFFLHLMKFKPDRVRQIVKKLRNNKSLAENRGGDRVSYKSLLKKESVRKFIGKLKGTQSHYNRKKSKRVYLSSELSIRKLHTIYNQSEENPDLKVSLSMFRTIFRYEFNIGFRSPASDICGYCAMMDNKIKNASATEKPMLFTEKRVHKKRAKCFYESMKEMKEGEKTICFDMQQVQPLPRTPIQQAFYARQIGLYNVCVMDVESQEPTFFIWTEEQAGRGSTEVASALLAYLNSQHFSGIDHIKLFSDGCTGQNKNNHVLHAIMYYLANHNGSLKKVTLTFPVRGHSFLPADRVFGRVEKLVRKKPTMIERNEYYEEYAKVGQVKKLGSDWFLKDVKILGDHLKQLPQISEMKVICIEKQLLKGNKFTIKVKGNPFYRFESNLNTYSLLKRGVMWANILKTPLSEVPLSHPISAAKKKDVIQLLTILFENNWKEDEKFAWYHKICFESPDLEGDELEVECDCLEDDCAMHL